MKSWWNWTYAVRALGVATFGVGVLWHDGSLVLGGLGIAGAPTVFKREP